ncbi:MAG TPA: phytoene/squalene synthase family protein [Planctomycetota bacterium]|nr:phytoene/squalene synthase family protein [Planctomycetota bacterium]
MTAASPPATAASEGALDDAPLSITESYAFCERQVRSAQSNFYRAFKLLPGERRKAIFANYAFMRYVDDLSDTTTGRDRAAARLADLRAALKTLFVTEPDPALLTRHESLPALVHATLRYQVDPAVYQSLLDGVEADLSVTRYATFEALKQYCYQVAGVVGLVCVRIWSDTRDGIDEHAKAGGYAVQLTNIIRDVAEDAQRGRIYLPAEDLARFKVSEEALLRGEDSKELRELLAFQAARARAYYAQAFQVREKIRPDCRTAWWLTLGAYEKLLDRIEKNNYEVMSGRIRLTFWDKVTLYVQVKRMQWWG